MNWKSFAFFLPLASAIITLVIFVFLKLQNPKISIDSGSNSDLAWLHDACSSVYASVIYFYLAALVVFCSRYFWSPSENVALMIPYLSVGVLLLIALLSPPEGRTFLTVRGITVYSIPGIMVHVQIDRLLGY